MPLFKRVIGNRPRADNMTKKPLLRPAQSGASSEAFSVPKSINPGRRQGYADDVSSIFVGESVTSPTGPTTKVETLSKNWVEVDSFALPHSDADLNEADMPAKLEDDFVPFGEELSYFRSLASEVVLSSGDASTVTKSVSNDLSHISYESTTVKRKNASIGFEGALSSLLCLSLLHGGTYVVHGKFCPASVQRIVQASIRQHITLHLEYADSLTQTSSMPIDVDNVSFAQENSDQIESKALEYIVQDKVEDAIEIYHLLLQKQMNRSSFATAMTLSKLSVLSLLLGWNKAALQYSSDALRLHREESRPVQSVLAMMEVGLVYFASNELELALKIWREALQMACMILGYQHPHVAVLLNNIGCLHFKSRNLSASIRALEESLALQKQLLRSSCGSMVELSLVQTSTTLGNIAMIVANCEGFGAAISILEETESIQESALQNEASDTIKVTQSAIGCLLDLQNQAVDGRDDGIHRTYTEEETHVVQRLQFTINRSRSIFGDNDGIPVTSAGIAKSALASLSVGDSFDSLLLGSLVGECTSRQRVRAAVLVCLEKDGVSSGGNGRTYKSRSIPIDLDQDNVVDAELHLEDIHSQAFEHLRRNESKDALDLFELSLKSHRDKYGDSHHLVGTALHNSGTVHFIAEQYVHAKCCFQEAVSVRTVALGAEHPDVAASLFKIGLIELARHNLAEAMEIFSGILQQIRNRSTTAGQAEEAKMLNNVGVVKYEMGNDPGALQCFVQAFEIQRRICGDSRGIHERSQLAVANSLSNIGYIYAKQRKYAEAYESFQEALQIFRKYLSPSHSSLVYVEENIAHVKAYGALDGGRKTASGLCSSAAGALWK